MIANGGRIGLSSVLDITFYLHSGFSCVINNRLFLFDYWLGENQELHESLRLTREQLQAYDQVYVLISHSHPDHFDPSVYEWEDLPNIHYLISFELPPGCKGRRMYPKDTLQLEDGIQVSALTSTDLGIAFLLEIYGITIFHAGDLNFWHWREESTAEEIDEAEEEFKQALLPLEGKSIDVAFFPVDPRQGRLYDAGANYFAMTIKPRLLIPMHFWGRNDLIVEYARRSRTRETEILVMKKQGDRMRIEFDDDGYMTINILAEPDVVPAAATYLDTYEEDDEEGNPFSDSDLPVKLDDE